MQLKCQGVPRADLTVGDHLTDTWQTRKCGLESICSEKAVGTVLSLLLFWTLVTWLRGLLLEHSSDPWILTEQLIKVNRQKMSHFTFAYVQFLYHDIFHIEDEFLEVFMLAYLLEHAYFTQNQVSSGLLLVNYIWLLNYVKVKNSIRESLVIFLVRKPHLKFSLGPVVSINLGLSLMLISYLCLITSEFKVWFSFFFRCWRIW